MQHFRTKLRAATADDHRRTEECFAAVLARLPHSYGDFLAAHAQAFPAIGQALAARLNWPAWAARWRELQSDLAALGLNPPPPATLAPAASRAAAIGMAYVLEGSRLGSTLLATRVPPGAPAAYLGGGRDRAPWQDLLALLETVGPNDETEAVDGARMAFHTFQDAAMARLPVPA